MLRSAWSFIRPHSPYFEFIQKVTQTSTDAETTPKPMQTHWLIPAMYMTTKITNNASNPPAKMNRYWLLSPLNSGLRPIPLLTLNSAILQEE